jgi:ADP-ribose pyrophosphatase YjhB (NUDIX family)
MKKELRGDKNHPYGYSCGGVVWRKDKKGGIEILLLHRFKSNHWNYDSWHLPKGTMYENEKREETVKREVSEETGYQIEVLNQIDTLKSIGINKDIKIYKTTYYFVCRPIKKVSSKIAEHDEIRWIELNEAIEKVSRFPIYEKEQIVLKKFKDLQLT